MTIINIMVEMNMNFAIPDLDWNDLGKSITRVCVIFYAQ
jgi:hypothetical protein